MLASSEQHRALLPFVQKLGLVSRFTRCLQCRKLLISHLRDICLSTQ